MAKIVSRRKTRSELDNFEMKIPYLIYVHFYELLQGISVIHYILLFSL